MRDEGDGALLIISTYEVKIPVQQFIIWIRLQNIRKLQNKTKSKSTDKFSLW